MATFRIRTYTREGTAIVIPSAELPVYEFEAKSLAECDKHLELRVADAKKLNRPCAVSLGIHAGRRPNGFDDHPAVRGWVKV